MERLTPPPVLAYGAWKNNGEMIADCFELGYIHDDDDIWDGTYGEGTFWKVRRPVGLTGTDLDPSKSPGYPKGVNATRAPWPDESFDVVVLDPDYKLSGTDHGGGERYGIAGAFRPVNEIMARMQGQLVEGHRVLRSTARHGPGRLMFKCQDQTNAAAKVWVADDVTNWAQALGMRKIGVLLFPSYRPQPERSTCPRCGMAVMRRKDGRWGDLRRTSGVDVYACPSGDDGHSFDPADNGQDTPHVNYSTLLVFEKTQPAGMFG